MSEYVASWDVFRDQKGVPVTITVDQMNAIWHAINIVERVRRSEEYQSIWSNGSVEIYKSRLLGRMCLLGKPPTRTKPPTAWGGPAWSELPGGDPFDSNGREVDVDRERREYERLRAIYGPKEQE